MTKGNTRSQLLAGLLTMGSISALAPPAFAQTTTRIEYMKQNQLVIAAQNSTTPGLAVSLQGPEAEWVLEPVEGGFFRIRSRTQPANYLNNEQKKLESGPIQPGWWSAMWTIKSMDSVYGWKICNRWTADCLQITDTWVLALGPSPTDNANAAWQLPGYMTPEKKGHVLVTPQAAPSANAGFAAASIAAAAAVGAKPLPAPAPSSRPSDTVSQAIGSGVATLSSMGDLDYRIYLDYCHSELADTDTRNTVTAEFWSDRSGLLGQQSVRGLPACSPLGAVVSLEQPFVLKGARDLVDYIAIKIDGDDAVFIDEVSLSKGTENRILHEGRDNGNGWCLSTDPNDATGTWKGVSVGGYCKPEWVFRLKR